MTYLKQHLIHALILCFVSLSILPAKAQTGNITTYYRNSTNPDHQPIVEALRRRNDFGPITKFLEDLYNVPGELVINFTDCGVENAYYSPSKVEVTVCYDLIKAYVDQTAAVEDYDLNVFYAAAFTFWHEVGHAMVHQLDLPIVGSSEEAADEFASMSMVWLSDVKWENALQYGAIQFKWDYEKGIETGRHKMYWTKHPLDKQRYYNLYAILYGMKPETYSFLKEYLPESRQRTSKNDYSKKDRAWSYLLKLNSKRPSYFD